MPRGAILSLSLAALLFTSVAAACPLCDSATGDRVRAEIRADFGANLLATTLPFAACLGLGALASAAVAREAKAHGP